MECDIIFCRCYLFDMRATRFEFERRFWIICGIYAVGFSLFAFDHIRFATALGHLIAPALPPGSPEALDSESIREQAVQRLIIGTGALLVFFSAALRTWGAAYLHTEVVHDTGQHSETLVADGPFRYTRNPLYLGNLPMAAGIGVFASRLGWLFLIVANWVFVYRLIFREEEALRQSQGEPFLAYYRAVPRFWPSLTPRVSSGNRAPQWGQAFTGESFVWLFGVAELCLALTLNIQIAIGLFVLGFLMHFLAVPLVTKRARKSACS
jgi:protein-S-isoprenylcysteine O-methyltransferase Ste14